MLEIFTEELIQLHEQMNLLEGRSSIHKLVKLAFVLPPRKLDQLITFFGTSKV